MNSVADNVGEIVKGAPVRLRNFSQLIYHSKVNWRYLAAFEIATPELASSSASQEALGEIDVC